MDYRSASITVLYFGIDYCSASIAVLYFAIDYLSPQFFGWPYCLPCLKSSKVWCKFFFVFTGTCINNTSVMMFKKGSFEIGGDIYPVAIKVRSWNCSFVFSSCCWTFREKGKSDAEIIALRVYFNWMSLSQSQLQNLSKVKRNIGWVWLWKIPF